MGMNIGLRVGVFNPIYAMWTTMFSVYTSTHNERVVFGSLSIAVKIRCRVAGSLAYYHIRSNQREPMPSPFNDYFARLVQLFRR